ncbi:hypothetical protein EPI10_031596 [Gossypium australe]|uniref:Uncharacterized protein n=1 Tax=Gossypium australe TaxID=47621 RepID=A0A5B6X0K2_9ROSI|nr:hypothetical protein EPI10_031596 [Gossypium australe]
MGENQGVVAKISSSWHTSLYLVGDFLQWSQCRYKNGGRPLANGSLLAKSYNETYENLERISSKKYYGKLKVVRVHEVDLLTSLTNQVNNQVSSKLSLFIVEMVISTKIAHHIQNLSTIWTTRIRIEVAQIELKLLHFFMAESSKFLLE